VWVAFIYNTVISVHNVIVCVWMFLVDWSPRAPEQKLSSISLHTWWRLQECWFHVVSCTLTSTQRSPGCYIQLPHRSSRYVVLAVLWVEQLLWAAFTQINWFYMRQIVWHQHVQFIVSYTSSKSTTLHSDVRRKVITCVARILEKDADLTFQLGYGHSAAMIRSAQNQICHSLILVLCDMTSTFCLF